MDIHNDLSMSHKGKLSLLECQIKHNERKENAREQAVCMFNDFIYSERETSEKKHVRSRRCCCCFDKKLEYDQSPPVITVLHGAVHLKCFYCSLFPRRPNINHEYAMSNW
jgi:hypothetical protein